MRILMVIAILISAMPTFTFEGAEGTSILLDPNLMCKKTRRLRGKLAEICRHDSALLKEIINGINLGFRECEFQFRYRRWNCSSLRRSMRKILMKDTRETGFVNAITSAGITYTVTKACTMGNLMDCSCEKSHPQRNAGTALMVNAATAVASLEAQQAAYVNARKNETMLRRTTKLQRQQHIVDGDALAVGVKHNIKQNRQQNRKRKLLRNIKFPDGEWEWGGCSDNVQFGFRHSRVFLDAKARRRSDLRTMVKLHNNHAGRLAIRDSMRLECKCHGLSGSCTVKTCWLKMPSFREVATRLRDKFDSAYKVVLRNDGNSFMPERESIRPPSKYDLVYTEDSSDFCLPNTRTGSLGTHERVCNSSSAGVDGCELLCCNRGHKHRIVSDWVNCKCVFKWCCEVTCEKCLERREVNTCL